MADCGRIAAAALILYLILRFRTIARKPQYAFKKHHLSMIRAITLQGFSFYVEA
jgi:hypothetical protein